MPEQPEDPLHYDMKVPPEKPRLKRDEATGSVEETDHIDKSDNTKDTTGGNSDTQADGSRGE